MRPVKQINVITGEEVTTQEEISEVVSIVCDSISDRQFYQQAAVSGFISEQEALDVMTSGILPSSISSFIDSMPSDQKFAAKMLLLGANTFLRSHPMTGQIGVMFSLSPEDLDTFWLEASKL